jgi:hypothetical protein
MEKPDWDRLKKRYKSGNQSGLGGAKPKGTIPEDEEGEEGET